MDEGASMKLAAKQISENWTQLQEIIKEAFDDDRLDNIQKLHKHFEQRMILAPASGVGWYHNAFPGGYVAHVLNIIDYSLKYFELFKGTGMYVDDIDESSVIFAALFHDLGKVGNLEQDYYITHNDEWKARKFHKFYDHNPEIHYMSVTDRSIWILGQFNIKMSESEYLGLRLADGLYNEQNKSYFMSGAEWADMKTNLPHIIHFADLRASRQEKEKYMFSGESRIDFPKIMKNVGANSDPENFDPNKLKEIFK